MEKWEGEMNEGQRTMVGEREGNRNTDGETIIHKGGNSTNERKSDGKEKNREID